MGGIVFGTGLDVAAVQDYGVNNPVIGYDNFVVADNITATEEDGDYPATNLANPNTSLEWRGADATGAEIEVITDRLDEIDYVGIAAHNFFSGGVPIKVQGRATAGGAWADLIAQFTPVDDGPLVIRFVPAVLYSIKLVIVASTDIPRLGILYGGALLVMERRLWVGHTPLSQGVKTEVLHGRAESGAFLGRIVTGRYTETMAGFRHLGADWYREHMAPFVQAAQEYPFFFVWRPSTYPLEGGFAALINDPMPQPSDPSHLIDIDLAMRGIA